MIRVHCHIVLNLEYVYNIYIHTDITISPKRNFFINILGWYGKLPHKIAIKMYLLKYNAQSHNPYLKKIHTSHDKSKPNSTYD